MLLFATTSGARLPVPGLASPEKWHGKNVGIYTAPCEKRCGSGKHEAALAVTHAALIGTLGATAAWTFSKKKHHRRSFARCSSFTSETAQASAKSKSSRKDVLLSPRRAVAVGSALELPMAFTSGPRLFLDTADVAEWERLLPLGIFTGVTTNPVLLERASVPCTIPALKELLHRAQEHGAEEVLFQTWGKNTETLVKHAEELREHDPQRVVVKIPLTAAGVKAGAILRKRQGPAARICMTACYSARQGLLAAGLGAEYIAPYVGRMSEVASKSGLSISGAEECVRLVETLRGLQSPTRVMVASIRSAEQMVDLARKGVDTFTFAPQICDELFDVHATISAAADFERAANASQGTTS